MLMPRLSPFAKLVTSLVRYTASEKHLTVVTACVSVNSVSCKSAVGSWFARMVMQLLPFGLELILDIPVREVERTSQ